MCACTIRYTTEQLILDLKRGEAEAMKLIFAFQKLQII